MSETHTVTLSHEDFLVLMRALDDAMTYREPGGEELFYCRDCEELRRLDHRHEEDAFCPDHEQDSEQANQYADLMVRLASQVRSDPND